MPDTSPEPAEPARSFDARTEARRLMRTSRYGSLATLDPATGGPYASLVSVAADVDGAPLLLISRLAVHTRNIEAQPACSLLLADVGAGDPLVHPRVSVTATAEKTQDPAARRRFLAQNPGAGFYADFADFAFYRLAVRGGHLVAGFGRIVDLTPADLLVDLSGAASLVAAEEEAIAHVNADHPEIAALYATRLLGLPPGPWAITGLDPEGCDLAAEDRRARLPFMERVSTPADLRKAFQRLAQKARAQDEDEI
ncbi:HugZ family pyridoxamine 5'-phosphate oxidase [Alsobacter sp. SYSU BS001988]